MLVVKVRGTFLCTAPRVRSRRRVAGFSLTEVLISLSLIGVVFASVFSALTQGFRAIELARDNTRCAQILQNEMERLRLLSWQEVSQLPKEESFAPTNVQDTTYQERFSCRRVIKEVKPGQVEITFFVEWSDNRGRTHTRQSATLVSRQGLNLSYAASI